MVEDLGDSSFYIDYHRNLNFARGPEAYLDIEPMAIIEPQKILSHHLHLSLSIQLEDVDSPHLQPTYIGNPSFASGNEGNIQQVVI